MQENFEEKLENKIYRMLADRIGQKWPVVWAKFVEAVESKAANAIVRDVICRHVVVNVAMEIRYGKANYYDRSLMPWHKHPLDFGQMFVHPTSLELSMIGYEAPCEEVIPLNSRDTVEKKEEPQEVEHLKKISDRIYLCRCFDGKWYKITYLASPKMWHFKEPELNFGHVDHLKRSGMDSIGGYDRRGLGQKALKELGLSND